MIICLCVIWLHNIICFICILISIRRNGNRVTINSTKKENQQKLQIKQRTFNIFAVLQLNCDAHA